MSWEFSERSVFESVALGLNPQSSCRNRDGVESLICLVCDGICATGIGSSYQGSSEVRPHNICMILALR